MNKTKKITSLLLAFTLVFVFFTTSVLADDETTKLDSLFFGEYYADENEYAGIPGAYFGESDYNFYPFEDVEMELSENYIKILITVDNKILDFSGETKVIESSPDSYTLSLEKYYGKIYLNRLSDGKVQAGVYLMDGYATDWGNGPYYFKFFTFQNSSNNPKEIETSFMQKVATDGGQYEMYISGFLNATVVNGANVFTSADIAKQDISIHVKNTVTGEIRVMTQSTIEGMTLNASGGTVTSITLKGRVQTPKGTFERYTTTVNI